MLLPIILPSHSYQNTSVLSSVRAFSLQGLGPQNVFTVWATNEGGMLDCHAQLHLGDVGSHFRTVRRALPSPTPCDCSSTSRVSLVWLGTTLSHSSVASSHLKPILLADRCASPPSVERTTWAFREISSSL